MEAIERIVHFGLSDRIAVPLGSVEGAEVYWHRVPPLFPDMRPLLVFWTADLDGGMTVIHAELSH